MCVEKDTQDIFTRALVEGGLLSRSSGRLEVGMREGVDVSDEVAESFRAFLRRLPPAPQPVTEMPTLLPPVTPDKARAFLRECFAYAQHLSGEVTDDAAVYAASTIMTVFAAAGVPGSFNREEMQQVAAEAFAAHARKITESFTKRD